jgi:beta-glucanase (GH16 family)
MRVIILLIAAALIAIGLPGQAGGATGPFLWDGYYWCPDHNGLPGCNLSQPSHEADGVWYSPAQVRRGPVITFTMRRQAATLGGITYAYASGAVNTAGHAMWAHGFFGAMLDLPCVNGQLADWPALWLNGTVGPWPGHGEIDIMEGLHGRPAWHYHYLTAAGLPAQVGGAVAGSWCGWHHFGVWWGTGRITWWYDGRRVGAVTSAELGVPVATDPMYQVANLNGCTHELARCPGGPFDGDAVMKVTLYQHYVAGVAS